MAESLKTSNFSVGYEHKALINDINLSVKPGEILSLIGPNGAGKTTIIKSLIRQLDPINGDVFIDNLELSRLSLSDFAKKISVVLTDPVKTDLMTVREVVATGRYPYTGMFGRLSEADLKVVDEAMLLTGISDIGDRDFLKISDGQRQRIMLARAICQETDIIIMDEPTSFLDIRYKLEFLSMLQGLVREKNKSVIMSIHEVNLARRVSNKIACIKGDRIDRYGKTEEVFSGDYVEKLYGIKTGSYSELMDNPELERTAGTPRVFVIAGCGTGAPLFRKLQREGIPFAAGILFENDMDYPVACALACEVVSVKAYGEIEDKAIERAREIIKECDKVYCTLDFASGRYGDMITPLAGLYDFAKEKCELLAK